MKSDWKWASKAALSLGLTAVMAVPALADERLTAQQISQLLQQEGGVQQLLQRQPNKRQRQANQAQVQRLGAKFDALSVLTGQFVQQRNQSDPKQDPTQAGKAFRQVEQVKYEQNGLGEVETTQVFSGSVQELATGRAPIEYGDQVQSLVDRGRSAVVNLKDMDKDNKLSAELAESPWSDDYWALYSGTLGKRYADKGFFNKNADGSEWEAPEGESRWKKNWKDYRDFVLGKQPENYVSLKLLDQLSPSEKYDVLVSGFKGLKTYFNAELERLGFETPYTLSERMWEEGEGYFKRSGKVETWMGVCHGWAPAAYMLNRPENKIAVKAVDGTVLEFYPSDIKALATLLWAKKSPRSRFIGGRCNDKEAAKDEKIGRIKDQKCFDTNPGSWHAAVVNQIGYSKRSFVMDATYDYEVWNQPVHSYEYTYFNPKTGYESNSLYKGGEVDKDLIVDLKSWEKDPFQNGERNYRLKKGDTNPANMAPKLVGVRMEVGYVVETSPNHNESDDKSFDAITYANYEYDLELDNNLNITGGEWYSNKHPDFLWTPTPGSRAQTNQDRNLRGSWDRDDEGELVKFPSSWGQPAVLAAYQESAPLAAVVEKLIEQSREDRDATPF